MGQTLTHGIYLPDEGERNCYNGLAANWSILDGAVGTVAEHTSALSGKAPLVHTHTKADITDFPAYGTTAGTICEGNDSRLSDARTPVAHTHTKSDVTDLLNSNFIPSANNSYDLGSSTNKWKTLNGINPGALSIFNPSASYDPIDIPTSWDTSGVSWNTLSVSNLGDGWICITYYNCSAGDYILARFGGTNGSSYPSLRFDAVKASDNKYYIYALFPVAKAFSNIYFKMLINSNANLTLHRYIPAYGTV